MKKYLSRCMIVAIMAIGLWESFCRWLTSLSDDNKDNYNFKYATEENNKCKDWSTDLWNCISLKENENTIIVRLLSVFWLDSSISKDRDLKFIDYAKAIVNMALSIVSFIALIITIYTFYLMFFSENEAWIKKAKWNLVGIMIALAIIWLAWLIVSAIFRWYNAKWQKNEWNIMNSIACNYSANSENNIENNQIYFVS